MLLENYARKITDIASENLGEEIVLFDTGEISLFSEFSILITGQTDRHLESLSQKIMREMKKNGKMRARHRLICPWRGGARQHGATERLFKGEQLLCGPRAWFGACTELEA